MMLMMMMMMNTYLLASLVFLSNSSYSKTSIHVGYNLTLAVPIEYIEGFNIGRGFLLETSHADPSFRVALSVEVVDTKYSCSLQVFLGDVMVWNSGHYSNFYTTNKCVLVLTEDGDLQLNGANEQTGWRTATFGQGVERLQILKTGNLVLVDALNFIKWQSFNFPTNIMLWGQRLNVATRLTSFPINSSEYFSFEIQQYGISLNLNSGKSSYSYWEFKPTKNRTIAFVELGSKGLELFNDKHKRIAQISSQRLEPLRYLALGNLTGNLGLYFYSSDEGNSFKAAFQALNSTCDLPLACKPYGICSSSNACSDILLHEENLNYTCDERFSKGQVEMLEVQGITNVLKTTHAKVNVSKNGCSSLCISDCECLAALYSYRACYLYRVSVGMKQTRQGFSTIYMIKVRKGNHTRSNVKKSILVVVGVVDGLIILVILLGLGFYCKTPTTSLSS